MENENSISLNKFISSTGRCSRREADRLIEQGRVLINGKKGKKGNRVFPGDQVSLDGENIKSASRKKALYIAYNKPPGIVSTTDPREPKNIISAINHKQRLFPIGRLDKPSQGLILLTNDGEIVNKILRASNHHEKEYIVRVNKIISHQFIRSMSSGIPILGTKTKKCKVRKINDYTFSIVLTQGLNRQIRRMCEFLDYKVTYLKRIRIMNIKLGDLESGKWRILSPDEVQELKSRTKNSRKDN